MGRAVPRPHGDWGGKARPSQVARGWGFAEEPHQGESWPKPRRRPRLATPPIPGAGTKPDSGQAGRSQARDLVPKQQVPVQAPREAAELQRESRPPHGRPFPASALTPPHSLRHTTLFSPRSDTGGAIFPQQWSCSHRLPLATYFGPESCARGRALPLAMGRLRPLRGPRPPVTSRASTRERPACAWTAAA